MVTPRHIRDNVLNDTESRKYCRTAVLKRIHTGFLHLPVLEDARKICIVNNNTIIIFSSRRREKVEEKVYCEERHT